MNDSGWFIFVAISRLVFARNLDITILELQNSICFPAVLGNIILFDSDSLCYFCDSIPCRKLDTLLAETTSHSFESNLDIFASIAFDNNITPMIAPPPPPPKACFMRNRIILDLFQELTQA